MYTLENVSEREYVQRVRNNLFIKIVITRHDARAGNTRSFRALRELPVKFCRPMALNSISRSGLSDQFQQRRRDKFEQPSLVRERRRESESPDGEITIATSHSFADAPCCMLARRFAPLLREYTLVVSCRSRRVFLHSSTMLGTDVFAGSHTHSPLRSSRAIVRLAL